MICFQEFSIKLENCTLRNGLIGLNIKCIDLHYFDDMIVILLIFLTIKHKVTYKIKIVSILWVRG
jgi:hypothetical protein